jgi:hypothetical protein
MSRRKAATRRHSRSASRTVEMQPSRRNGDADGRTGSGPFSRSPRRAIRRNPAGICSARFTPARGLRPAQAIGGGCTHGRSLYRPGARWVGDTNSGTDAGIRRRCFGHASRRPLTRTCRLVARSGVRLPRWTSVASAAVGAWHGPPRVAHERLPARSLHPSRAARRSCGRSVTRTRPRRSGSELRRTW